MSKKQSNLSFVKYHTCLSYMFNPAETRFILHMLNNEFMNSKGYYTEWTRNQYMKIMGLTEYSFVRAVKRLTELKLLVTRHNAGCNRVYYSLNLPLYNKLLSILSATNEVNTIIEFCNLHFKENSRSIESITEEEISKLREAGESKKKFRYTESFPYSRF